MEYSVGVVTVCGEGVELWCAVKYVHVAESSDAEVCVVRGSTSVESIMKQRRVLFWKWQ